MARYIAVSLARRSFTKLCLLQVYAEHLYFIKRTQQKYTQRGGVRPFGIATLLGGFDSDGKPVLYQTDPAGTHSSWKAQVLGGRNTKSLREFLEKNWTDELTQEDATKLAVKALLEVVDSGAKNMEVCLLTKDSKNTTPDLMSESDLDACVAAIEAEKDENMATAPSK